MNELEEIAEELSKQHGYCLFRYNRNRFGGGVAIYCIDNLLCSLLSCGTSPSGAEFLWVSVKSGCFHPSLTLGCFYHPPASPSQSVHGVCDNIESMMLTKKQLIACGDFNINMSDPSKFHSKIFQNIYHISFSYPTHLSPNSLLQLFRLCLRSIHHHTRCTHFKFLCSRVLFL